MSKQNNNVNHLLPLHSFFTAKDILCDTRLAGHEEVIRALAQLLRNNQKIEEVESCVNAVLERENRQSTVVEEGLAVPHARVDGLEKPVIGIATSSQGIVFPSSERGAVHLVVQILTPKDNPTFYLEILRALGSLFQETKTIRTLAALKTSEDIWNFFHRGGVFLPDYICAGDIMIKKFISLKESDTLKDAIDNFVNSNLISLPVVDKQGELVGVVTAFELFQVCLPEYILWIEDLSPIINFEPFVNALKNEKNTWLSDIMIREYVAIPEDTPAIEVAKKMIRQNRRYAYVVENKKLVGIITLQHFLNTIFRE